jgi:hypothetical protein
VTPPGDAPLSDRFVVISWRAQLLSHTQCRYRGLASFGQRGGPGAQRVGTKTSGDNFLIFAKLIDSVPNQFYYRVVSPTEGRRPSSRTRDGMRWTRQRRRALWRADEAALKRTAKSCGPDAAALASSPGEANASRGRWWQESTFTRESTYKP